MHRSWPEWKPLSGCQDWASKNFDERRDESKLCSSDVVLSRLLPARDVAPITEWSWRPEPQHRTFNLAPVTDLYESLNRGVIDGAVIGWPATRSYRVAELTSHHLEAPLGAEVTFIMMNKKSYGKLDAKDRGIIDNASGGRWATAIGKILDGIDKAQAERVAKVPDETVAQLPAAEQAKWKAQVEQVVDEWTKRTPNGAAVLAAYREEIAKLTKR